MCFKILLLTSSQLIFCSILWQYMHIQLSDIIFESNIHPKHCHLCLLSVFGSSHGLSGSEPEPATIVRSQAIWSQSRNSSLAPLIYSLAHVASSFELSRGNTNLAAATARVIINIPTLSTCHILNWVMLTV